MNILVTTPTGQIGNQVVRGLLRAGVQPTVLVRDPARLAPDIANLVRVAQGSLNDPDAVAGAVAGVDALFWLNPPNYGSQDPIADYRRYAETLAGALPKSGAPHIVHLSSDGAEDRGGRGLIDALGDAETILDSLGVNVLHLRPGFFFENFLWQVEAIRHGMIVQTVPGDTVTNFVATQDIAEIAVARLLARNWSGSASQLVHGPERLSFLQAAAAISDGVGKAVAYREISESESRAAFLAMGGSETVATHYLQMFRAMLTHPAPADPRTPAVTGRTTLAEWAFRTLRPIVGA
ncbi:MAG: NAD(P)H-binding protein [Fimbriimonadaceae bacterium]|nr:NAD(P)H-binding protein [Fimbriimonadaceae bacterium]